MMAVMRSSVVEAIVIVLVGSIVDVGGLRGRWTTGAAALCLLVTNVQPPAVFHGSYNVLLDLVLGKGRLSPIDVPAWTQTLCGNLRTLAPNESKTWESG